MKYDRKLQEKLTSMIGKHLKRNKGNITRTALDLEISTWKVLYWTNAEFRAEENSRRRY